MELCAISCLIGLAIQAAQRPSLSVDVDLVNVSLSVRDQNGTYQTGLTASDLLLLEDGVPQHIQFFSRELEAPVTLALVLDLSASQREFIESNIDTAATFFRQVLRPQDQALVAAFGPPPFFSFQTSRVKLIRDFTSSEADLAQAVRNVALLYGGSHNLAPKSNAGCSPVHDALYYTACRKLKTVGGRKTVLLLSDGEDTSSRQSASAVIEMLQSADAILYALNAGLSQPRKRYKGGAHPQASRLDQIALETGGQEFQLPSADLKAVFDQIEAEMRSTYTIGYVSSNRRRDGAFRKIRIQANRPGLTVRARTGYRAPND